MTEKSKNDQKRKYSCGCGLVLLLSILCLASTLFALREGFRNGFALGPGLADFCRGFEWLHYDFEVAGRVVNTQGQPVQQAQVELGSEGSKSCIAELSSYRVLTNENGEFSFGPDLFEYGDEFFISVSIPGCPPSVFYDDFPDNEPVIIVLDCDTTSTL